MKIQKWDMVILIGSVVFSFIPYALRFPMYSNISNNNATISVSGTAVKSLKLDKNGIFEFEFDGKKGFVEISEKKVRMLKMDKETCPEGICSNRGWIESSSENIVCLPNRIIVTLGKSNSDVDISTN